MNMDEKKSQIFNMSGLCTNCDNIKDCDFLIDINAFMRNNKNAEKILDTEVSIYSCDNYSAEKAEKNICSQDKMCLSCKQEV